MELKGKEVKNELVDEVYEIEESDNDILRNKEIKNQHYDEEISFSEGNNNNIPSPRDDDDNYNNENIKTEENNENLFDHSVFKTMFKDPEIISLYKHLKNFTPKHIAVEPTLKPFIPEYIPAVGEVDGYIKPPRPDNKEEILGIEKLDEYALTL